jgi:hypothetical protein
MEAALFTTENKIRTWTFVAVGIGPNASVSRPVDPIEQGSQPFPSSGGVNHFDVRDPPQEMFAKSIEVFAILTLRPRTNAIVKRCLQTVEFIAGRHFVP